MPIDSVSSSAPPSPADSSGAAAALAVIADLVLRVALALLFYGVVMPLAMLLRALRVDLLGLRRDDDAQSYWRRADPGDGTDPM